MSEAGLLNYPASVRSNKFADSTTELQ